MDTVYILKVRNKLVSTARLVIEEKLYDPLSHIEDVITEPTYRNKGYGKFLVTHILKISKERGCYKTVLECTTNNSDFYVNCNMEKSGYSFTYRFKV